MMTVPLCCTLIGAQPTFPYDITSTLHKTFPRQ